MLPTRLASLPPPPPPPLRAYETTRMLQTMIQDIDDVPLSYFSLLFPLAPILADRRLSTSYSSVPIAGWLSFVRLSSVSRQVVILRLSCVSCRITRLSGQLQTWNNYQQRGDDRYNTRVYFRTRIFASLHIY